ncbi:MAG: hypothetical protein JSW53_06380 [Candidatus Bathyarchaeota archaeon]|nr:MAG: hypothetical protein JSW53_06380 [Candidatus Bathyarchaeota archaeon]
MMFDISLSLALSLITAAVLFVHTKLGVRVKSLLGGREFTTRDAVLLVVMMGVMVTLLGWTIISIPPMAIVVLFLYAYSSVLFIFAYLIVPKWYLALLAPALFIALYFLWWNLILLNLFAVIFAISVSVYIGSLFTWKTTAIFVTLLTIMDVVQVLITGFMVESGEKTLSLGLPVAIALPSFPLQEYMMFLGLGDIFLSGLLTIQNTQKYGKRWGIATIVAIGAVFLLLETILLNSEVAAFPATVLVIAGWLTALGIRYLYKSLIFRAD